MDRPLDQFCDDYLSVPQTAKTLKVAESKVRGWILSEELHAVNIGNGSVPRWRISRADLHRFLAHRSRENMEL